MTNAQNNSYKTLWAKVTEKENTGLTKSALTIVTKIEQKAAAQKNNEQSIKSLLYKSKYMMILEEDAQLSVIKNFKTLIKKSDLPTKNILNNMLGKLYWDYFKNNRYKFYNRTKTSEKVNNDDFRLWDLQTLFTEIKQHYIASLKNGLILQENPKTNYKAFINLTEDSKTFRPSLYDLLAHNALDFFKHSESSITNPIEDFNLNYDTYFSDATTFSKIELPKKNKLSNRYLSLKTFQNLIKYHKTKKEFSALALVNIERLNYLRNNTSVANKETLYLNTLLKESKANTNNKASTLYLHQIADFYYDQGDDFKSNPKYRFKFKEALDVCKEAILKFPNSLGAKKCEQLKYVILKPEINVTSEAYIPSNIPSKVLVTYKNIANVSFKIAKVSSRQLSQFETLHKTEERKKFTDKLPAYKQWDTSLINKNDYQTHTTEVKIPELEFGDYIIITNSKSELGSFTAFQHQKVTDNLLLEIKGFENKQFQLTNRINGQPIANASIDFIIKDYRRRVLKVITKTTDNKGFTYFDNSGLTNRRYLDVKVNNGKDISYFKNFRKNYYYDQNSSRAPYSYSYIFTDRSIYRPNQTIHYKTVSLNITNKAAKVITKKNCTIRLFDTNNQLVSEQKNTTNEYGSTSGTFTIPNNGLTGNYRIEIQTNKETTGYINFKVEEYKRPKFEISFTPIKEAYKVNDSIIVKGKVMAYAGAAITNAKVVYKVKRNVRYPTWYYNKGMYSGNTQEIAFGETTTNTNGEFNIPFTAIPDSNILAESLPIYNYTISADVTDINGETRSSETVLNAGYHTLIANLSIDNRLDKCVKNHNITINTENLNNVTIPATGTVTIYKLKTPNQVLRDRPWSAPDYNLYKQSDFNKWFPYESYTNNQYYKKWNNEKVVLSKPFNTEKSNEINLKNIKKWDSGYYRIILESKDNSGHLIKDEVYTNLYSNDDKTIPRHQLFEIKIDKDFYKPGDKVKLSLSSAVKNLNITLLTEKKSKITNREIVTLNNSRINKTLKITESDYGNFIINYSYSYYNTINTGKVIIYVPYPKQNIAIETLTFRDKLEPNHNETWSFKVLGKNNEALSTELLASMYDASLDQFTPHNWNFNSYNPSAYRSQLHISSYNSLSTNNYYFKSRFNIPNISTSLSFDYINWFGFSIQKNRYVARYNYSPEIIEMVEDDSTLEEVVITRSENEAPKGVPMDKGSHLMKSKKTESELNPEKPTNTKKVDELNKIQARTNLKETAFFFPKLTTNKKGEISFSFKTPEALTKWNVNLLAHNKTGTFYQKKLTAVTQKELMVIPNTLRFLREGDTIKISTKIANISNKALNGDAILIVTDPITNKDVSHIIIDKVTKKFSVKSKENTKASWVLSIPKTLQALQYKIVAKAGNYSDGEQNTLPVLTNRMLVTESLPMHIKSNETKTFTLNKLKNNTSKTLNNHNLILEVTANPAWSAIQSLPYLMEYPYECNEQTFSRYYANAMASYIVNNNPRIKTVFDSWKNSDALISNLEKNSELKSIIINETPWLRDAKNETEQKKRIGLLFDLNKMNNELDRTITKLEKQQMPSGGWSWFGNYRENRFITQQIITGFGHLKQLNITSKSSNRIQLARINKMINKAINYLDNEYINTYNKLAENATKKQLKQNHLSSVQLNYLYLRSFFPEYKKNSKIKEINNYYLKQISTYWLKESLYNKGLMALILHRNNNTEKAKSILASLKENSITNEELGMYWKQNTPSYSWYQEPITTQALLIEAFAEIEQDNKTIDNLKIWLLKNKQTNKWSSTKATTQAVYALLLQGNDWLSVNESLSVKVGNKTITPNTVEAGTGYYKTNWSSEQITPEKATVTLTKKGNGIAWAGLYWQYFEDLDKITPAETNLKLDKKLFIKRNTANGKELNEITENTKIKVGDLITVRITLHNDRRMEFVHLKDLRASGLEPVNVLSRYKYQDGLGYYESTKDVATNFFFDVLPKGLFVFEYDLRVSNSGQMSNGITTIQSMYAPEFSSHSEGIRLNIE